ncbi:hypothetical protein [Virgibacillus kimchii]
MSEVIQRIISTSSSILRAKEAEDNMPDRVRQNIEPAPHYDGRREGVLYDSSGAKYSINLDKKAINPKEIKEIREAIYIFILLKP